MSPTFIMIVVAALLLLAFLAWRTKRGTSRDRGGDGSSGDSGSWGSDSSHCDSSSGSSCDGGGGDGGGGGD